MTDQFGNYQPGITDNGISDGATTSGAAGLSGTGSPEGVVEAVAGTTYFDTASAIFWVKQTDGGTTGWYQLVG